MKKIIYLTLIMILIAGCGGNKGGGTDAIITPEDVYSGSEGLDISFLEKSPPEEVYEETLTTIGLNIKNKGAYDINEGYLAISLETDYMESIRSSLESRSDNINFGDYEHITFDLSGKSLERAEGEEDILTFTTEIKELEKLSQKHTTAVAVTACYNYKTSATATVCIDTDVHNLKERTKSCTIKPISLTNQGAPIAITKVETKMIPEDGEILPQFKITLENKDDGLPIDKDSVVDACYSRALNYDKINKIEVSVYLTKRGQKIQLDCNLNNDEKIAHPILKDKKATISCRYEEGINKEDGTYPTPLIIEADYGYTNTISKQIDIKKVS